MGKPLNHQTTEQVLASSVAIAFANMLKPAPVLDMDDWADDHRWLPQKSSPEPGRWKTSRVPFVREIMKALSAHSNVEDVSLMKGTQIAGSETGNNFFGYNVCHAPGPMMIVQPNLGMAKRYSRQRLASMIEAMPVLRERIASPKARDGGNTVFEKDFFGGFLVITGAESATGLRSMPVRYLFLDEIDAYPHDVDGEGDPVQLAIKRTQNFFRKKIFRVSTPTVDGTSRIQKSFLAGDQRHYYLPCPHCGGEQHLEWGGIKWNKTLPIDQQPSSAYYECKHCKEAIHEHEKTKMLEVGRWVAHNPSANPKKRSYHINSLYSPLGWYSWQEAVEDWFAAKSDIELKKTFYNTVLALPWKEEINNVSAEKLKGKADDYVLGKVPEGGLILFAGTDTQDDRLESYIYAMGENEETWLVDYEIFIGDPGVPETEKGSPWAALKDWWLKPRQHISGAWLEVEGMAVDTGGHHTQDVYNFCRNNKHLSCIAVKGSSKRNQPIINRPNRVDIDWRGRLAKKGLELYAVGTDTAKSLIYSRFSREDKGAGFIHFPESLPLEIFEQLTSEKLTRKYKRGFATYEWVKESHARNEALDCLVYAIAAAHKHGVHRWSISKWQTLKEQVAPRSHRLFGDLPPPTTKAKQKTKRRGKVKTSVANW